LDVVRNSAIGRQALCSDQVGAAIQRPGVGRGNRGGAQNRYHGILGYRTRRPWRPYLRSPQIGAVAREGFLFGLLLAYTLSDFR